MKDTQSKFTIPATTVALLAGVLLGCGAKNVITRARAGDSTSQVPRVTAVAGTPEVLQCPLTGACVQYVLQRNLARGFGEWQVFPVAGQAVATHSGGELAAGTGNPPLEVDATLPEFGSGQGRAIAVTVSEPGGVAEAP